MMAIQITHEQLGATRQSDRIREPATPTRDAYLRPKSQSTTIYIILRQSNGQVTKVPGLEPHITTDYYAENRNRTPHARISLHIQKPKPQASIKNEIEKSNELFDAYNTIHER